MKIRLWNIITVLFITLLLVGCGTVEHKEPEGGNRAQGLQEEKTDNEHVDLVKEVNERKLTYNIEGELYEETAFLGKSDNQNFSLYIFNEYELEAEEPRKDVVISKEDGNVFMRIEILPKDVDLNKVKSEIPIRAKAVSDEYFHNETVLMSEFLEGSVWYKAYTEKFAVSVILVKSKEQPIILTIHTPREKEVIPLFIAMAETIEKEQGKKK